MYKYGLSNHLNSAKKKPVATYLALHGFRFKKRKQLFKNEHTTLVTELMRLNIRARNEFQTTFSRMFLQAKAISKEMSELINRQQGRATQKSLMSMFDRVISLEFCGTFYNKRILMKIVKLIITRSWQECIYESDLYRSVDIKKVPWIPETTTAKMQQMLWYMGVKMLLFHIITPMFNKLFRVVHTRAVDCLYVPRKLWNRAIDQLMRLLVVERYISKVQVNPKLSQPPASLLFKPKSNDVVDADDIHSFRIIACMPQRMVRYRSKTKRINQQVHQLAKQISFVNTGKNFLKEFRNYISKQRDLRLFVVKLDISDCFGNVKIDILDNALKISRFSESDKKVLHNAMHNQYITYGKSKKTGSPILYKWAHGLLQGVPYSSGLCELYLATVENDHFTEFDNPNCFIYRTVDDYFFVSTQRNDVRKFEEMACNEFRINNSKTQSNVAYMGEHSTLIQFCGMEVDIKKFTIQCAFNTPEELHRRFRFWNFKNPVLRCDILIKATTFSPNNFYFQPAFMSVKFNGVHRVFVNFFESMTFVAMKFDTAIMSATFRKSRPIHYDTIHNVAFSTIQHYANKMVAMNNLSRDMYFHRGILIIGLQAFRLVFQQRKTSVYNQLVKEIVTYFSTLNDPSIRHLFCQFNKIPERLQYISTKRTFQMVRLRM